MFKKTLNKKPKYLKMGGGVKFLKICVCGFYTNIYIIYKWLFRNRDLIQIETLQNGR